MMGSIGLNGLNFFTAAVQSGFGPFVTVWLSQNGWDLERIGVALSLGTLAQLIAQLPSGYLVDHIHHKRNLTIAALAVLAASAVLLSLPPSRTGVWSAEVLHAVASAVLVPAIAALTLSLCGQASFSQRLGVNARYAALGGAASAAFLGFAASLLSERAVFTLTAALILPAVLSLLAIQPTDHIDPVNDHPALLPAKEREFTPWCIFRNPVLHMFAVAIVLFHLANAALLPTALNNLTMHGVVPGYLVSATIIVPQAITALLSPWVGSLAQSIGRRPVLLVGFAAVPLRALLLATHPFAAALVVFQVLDGVSATVFGLMLPLIAADVTKDNGYLNMAIGSLGLAVGLGATFSTIIAGAIGDAFGDPAAFGFSAAAGLASVVMLAVMMPETRTIEVKEEIPAVAPWR